MKTPKELFQATPYFRDFQALIANASFEPACQAALAEMISNLPSQVPDLARGWDSYLQILGARAFIDQLSRLHEPPEKPRRTPWPELKPPA
jgi:hypothetical protein